ncbi:hypothetical protein [Tenacibaculum finnmarkense]|uniref:Uncharacterized protein n=1 Tax=Tenacibaculum finnmarkense genomovar ulcerans TaxID=2781388 RepID=A0A2I2MA97_9FLAO|nr:hypothetical protein [Tenacibaculum finnmarkense]MBE7688443.1 hypothetical protein [Tenacibaculum finnmarkense genomovar ulcerans]MCG8734001.1 hypothetical protein [Tenacibaculum finnmarkense]SOU89469.1 conserved hypothetical protein [Tenacibaculum finnmarkense genomovar ulcerans]
MITLEIPIKPYLKKYLTQKYGEKHTVKESTLLGGVVIDILDRNYKKEQIQLPHHTTYQLQVPGAIVQNVGFDISFVKLKKLAERIRKIFYNDLDSYINISIGQDLKVINEKYESINKQNRILAIRQFLEHHQITEDEISADSVYRAMSRMS